MKYVCSLSFGKDSIALLLEIIRRKMPLDYVVFCDIKFNDTISGEHPLMTQWIPIAEQKINKILTDNGYNVKIQHLTAKKNFCEQFYTIKGRGNHIGDCYGFPYIVGAWCNDRLKLEPLHKFMSNTINEFGEITEYIGIAKDEPKRLERYKSLQSDKHKYVTLADLGITESTALEICKQNDLLSPKYKNSFRGGCWFCVKQPMYELWNLWHDFPQYYKLLEDMEKDSPISFKQNTTLEQIRKQFESGKRYTLKPKQITIFD